MTPLPQTHVEPSPLGGHRIWRLIAGYRHLYLWAALAQFASTVFQFMAPLVASATIDFVLNADRAADRANPFLGGVLALIGGPDAVRANLWLAAAAMVGFVALGGLFNFLQRVAAAKASDGVCRRLKDQLYDRLQRLDNRWLDRAQTGDLVQRCTSDVETTRIFLASHVVEIGRSAILLATVVPVMLSLHVGLTIVSMMLVPGIVAYSYFYIKRVKIAFHEVDEAEGRLTAVAQENIIGIRVVRAFARHQHEIEKFAQPNREYRDSNLNLMRHMAWFWTVSDLACVLQIGLALVVGAYLALAGSVTIGTVFAFLALLNMVLWPVRMIGRILTDLGKTIVSLGRIHEILEQPIETATDTKEIHLDKPLRGHISFRDVTFSHQPGSPPTVEAIDLEVEPGQTLAILGPSGSGKTTLMNLLLRFYDCDVGSISIDGYDIRKLDRSYLRNQFGVVLQEPFLYSRSIRRNIQLGTPQASDRAIEEAARMASIHDTVQGFSKGYDTEIGERGVALSGGQRQRIAISRAILRNPPTLLLDDALSAVDSETESSIINALQSRRGHQTTIVIAHRLSTLAHADKIAVLENGRITQMGTHSALVEQPGLYARLWSIQTQLESNLQEEETSAAS